MEALEILANLSWRFTLHFPCLTIFVFLSPPTRGQNFCRSGKTLHRFVSTVWPGVCNRGCGFEKSCPVTRGRSIRRFSRQSSSRLSRSLSLSLCPSPWVSPILVPQPSAFLSPVLHCPLSHARRRRYFQPDIRHADKFYQRADTNGKSDTDDERDESAVGWNGSLG